MKAKLPILCAMLAAASLTANARTFTIELEGEGISESVPVYFDGNIIFHRWDVGFRDQSKQFLYPTNREGYKMIASDKNDGGGKDYYIFSLMVPIRQETNNSKEKIIYGRLTSYLYNKSGDNGIRFAYIFCGSRMSSIEKIKAFFSKDFNDFTSIDSDYYGLVASTYQNSPLIAKVTNNDDVTLSLRFSYNTQNKTYYLNDNPVSNYTVSSYEKICDVGKVNKSCLGYNSTTQRFQNTENKSILVKKQQ